MNRKKTIIKILCMLTAIIISFSLAAGCNSKSSEQPSSQDQTSASDSNDELIKISFGTSPWPTSMFAYLAQEKGFFAENGLEVELNTFGSFGDSLQAFVGGNIDIVTAASPDTLAPFSQGADFQIVMMTDKSMGSDGMVASKDIKSINDLAGKTVATELYSVDHMYLLSLLDEAGMSADDITLTNMTIADAGTAFIAGQVDAAVIWEPYLSRAVSEGDGNLLYSTKDNPDLITDCVAVSAKLLEESPKAIQAFVDSWYQAVKYWQENEDDANAVMAAALEVSAEDFADMMDTLYITSARDSLEAFEPSEGESSFISINQSIAEFLKELKVIEKLPDVSEMINTEFLKNSAMLD